MGNTPPTPKPIPNEFKFVFVGDLGIGKTSLFLVHSGDGFRDFLLPTVYDNYSRSIEWENQKFEVSFYDTPGQEEYSRLRPLSYPGTDLFFICYSIDNHNSFKNVKDYWYNEIQNNNIEGSRIILLGLRTDLRDDKNTLEKLSKEGKEPLTYEHGENMAKEINAIGYVECSAIKNNIQQVFDEGYKYCVYKRDICNNPKETIHDYYIPLKISKAKSARK